MFDGLTKKLEFMTGKHNLKLVKEHVKLGQLLTHEPGHLKNKFVK